MSARERERKVATTNSNMQIKYAALRYNFTRSLHLGGNVAFTNMTNSYIREVKYKCTFVANYFQPF